MSKQALDHCTTIKLFGVQINATAADHNNKNDHVVRKPKETERWTDEEQIAFLRGLNKHGKGNWKLIADEFVKTRNSTQVASHAQKHFNRLANPHKKRRRGSVFDVVIDEQQSKETPDEATKSCVGRPPMKKTKTSTGDLVATEVVPNSTITRKVVVPDQVAAKAPVTITQNVVVPDQVTAEARAFVPNSTITRNIVVPDQDNYMMQSSAGFTSPTFSNYLLPVNVITYPDGRISVCPVLVRPNISY